jgi:phage terminase large subunit GpA-like protein
MMGTAGIAEWTDAIWRRGIAPDLALSVSEWADTHRMLPPSSAEPGPWRTSRLPFLREIMDCLVSTSGVDRVVVMKAAQVGGTECALNFIGYAIHQVPANIMLVMPSTEMIRRNTPTRIDPLIEHTPVLRSLVVPFRSRDGGNSTTRKAFIGGELVMVGANSPLGLRSLPARYILLDEIDAYPVDADGEGDPVALAERAAITFRGRRKILMVSTPTTAGFSRIETAYAESDQRKWFVPCADCGEHQVLEWENVRWPEGRRDQAHLVCVHCGVVIDDAKRLSMVSQGEWRALAPGAGKPAGFHIGGLLSPFHTMPELAIEHGQVCHDPPRAKAFRNIKLGELWHDEAATPPDALGLFERLEEWGPDLPAGVVLLTAGVDTQDDRLEYEIVGWGRDEESWSIEHRTIWGDPAGPEVWKALDHDLARSFRHARDVAPLPIRAACVDSGGHHTASVYRYAAERASRRIWAIKGRGGPGVPVWPRRPSRKKGQAATVFIVGVDAAKEALYARLKRTEPGAGYCHFPKGRGADWFRQLTAESLATRYVKGRPVREWRKAPGDRNEALDCRVYAAAALQGLIALGARLNAEAEILDARPLRTDTAPGAGRSPSSPPTVIRSKWLGR